MTQNASSDNHKENRRAIIMSAWPPAESSTAAFADSLLHRLPAGGKTEPALVAVCGNKPQGTDRLIAQFSKKSRFAHTGAAELINESGADVLLVQHDFNTYGGENGEYLADLLARVSLPYTLTCHEVPSRPDTAQQRLLADLCYYSEGVAVFGQAFKQLLEDVYDVDPQSVSVIPHGVSTRQMPAREDAKALAGLKGRTVISTYGLISPGKGIEYGLESVAQLAGAHPDICYVVMGCPHPQMDAQYRGAYLGSLHAKAAQLGLEDHVRFITRPPNTADMYQLIDMSDIYMTPYLSQDQAQSQTLACAVGRGRVVVSTPFLYAQEMLAEGRGLLARFGDAGSLARCIKTVLENPEIKRGMEESSARLGRCMAWPAVCRQYDGLLEKAQMQTCSR